MSSPLPIILAPRASRQIEAARRWWIANRAGVPGLFDEELDRAFELIASLPLSGPLLPSAKIVGLRRIYLSRIRYYLYYRAAVSTIDVLAFWHSSRGAGPF